MILSITRVQSRPRLQLAFGINTTFMLLILLFFSDLAQNSTANQDIQSDNLSTSSQDSSQDSNERFSSHETSGISEAHEDETGDNSDGTVKLPEPIDLSVIRLNDSAVVLRWDFPENYQEHLQFFKVQYRSLKSKNSKWLTDNQEVAAIFRACQVKGLRPGNYLFSVLAVYDNDDNVSSKYLKFRLRARSKIKQEELPEMKAPEIYWSEAKGDYFRFKWKYEPKEADFSHFGFLVFYRSLHRVSDYIIYSTLDSSAEIEGLYSGTPYEAKVLAYNTVAVSNFSDTIIIKTEAQPNETATVVPSTNQSSPESQNNGTEFPMSTSTTRRPLTVSWPPNSRDESRTTVPSPVDTQSTLKPNVVVGPPSHDNNSTSYDVWKAIVSGFNAVIGDQSDAMLIIRYLLLVMVPVLFIVSVLICLIRGPSPTRKRNDSPPSTTTDDSMQFDLEINGYFKNSFPGVEKEYPPVTNHNDIRHGFVNNHPHLNEFA